MPMTYRHCGGDIIGPRQQALGDAEAATALALHRTRADADDPLEAQRALRLAAEIEVALVERARWRRAALAHHRAFERPMNSSRELTLGSGASGTGRPRKAHSGPQPCETS